MLDRGSRLNASRPRIRPYRPDDRKAVRHVCCETGRGGLPVDPLFADRELFADFLTRYYTDFEPESTLVVEDRGRVVGYLTGCLRPLFNRWVQRWIGAVVGTKAVVRLALGSYDQASRAYLRWAFLKAHWEIPSIPRGAGHLHLNLLPEYRNRGLGLRLYRHFLALVDGRASRLFVRVESSDGRRSHRAFQRFGFRPVDRRRISRSTGTEEPVYVSAYAWERTADGRLHQR